jgi:hypothetical protein
MTSRNEPGPLSLPFSTMSVAPTESDADDTKTATVVSSTRNSPA